jgi:glyoxylase-like metal-dependent hydrolase (beta-lactamase superfamily II)
MTIPGSNARLPTRRAFLADLGRGLMAGVVIACGGEATTTTSTANPPSSTSIGATPESTPQSPPSTTTAAVPTTLAASASGSEFSWGRVDLGFVSAYRLVRGDESVLVDTGVSGSERAIESTLGELGLGWADLDHVIVTHEHGDHAGSSSAVLEAAEGANGYAAQPDLERISSPRPLLEVADGDTIAGMTIVATPGHTDGHISVLVPGQILLTGDAINNTDGVLSGPNPQFSSDMPAAVESAKLLGTLDYEIALFGHGSPIEADASSAVAGLAAGL